MKQTLGFILTKKRTNFLRLFLFPGWEWSHQIFFVYAGSGSGQTQNIESQIWLYSVRWGGNKWPRRPSRPLGGELQCGGLRPLCEGLLGGSSVEEGVGQPARECLRWWWSVWSPLLVTMWVIPDFRIRVMEKNFGGSKNSHVFRHQILQSSPLFYFIHFTAELKQLQNLPFWPGMPYLKSDHDILGEPFIVRAPLNDREVSWILPQDCEYF